MDGYEKRTIKKRQDILDASRELFFANGITSVTIEQIAEKANVSRVTLFKYFGDKESLVNAVIQDWVNELMADVDKILDCDLPFQHKLTRILNLGRSGNFVARSGNIKMDIRGNRELMSVIKAQIKLAGLPKILRLIDQGKQAGVIEPSLNDDAILAYFSLFSPMISDPNYIHREESFQISLYNLFMGGLIKDWYRNKPQEN